MPDFTQTITTKIQKIYSDFTDSFDKAPFSNDLAIVTNENSVKQSIKNIVLTVLGERLYDNTIGSLSSFQLFELDDIISTNLAIQAIKDALGQNEPRAQILQVLMNNQPDDNYFEVQIYFKVSNNPNTLNTSVILNRVR